MSSARLSFQSSTQARAASVNSPSSSLTALRQKVRRYLSKDGPLRRDYADKRAFAKEVALYFAYIYAGWNDATAGALIPAIQEKYKISFSIVSLLFVANLFGSLASTAVTPELIKRFTFGRAITITAGLTALPSLIIACGSPFPVMACSYALFGLGIGAMDAICNAWVSARPNARIRLGFLHTFYGVGALLAPLAGSPFVVKGIDFHYFYFASLALSLLNTTFVTACFRFKKEGYPGDKPADEQNSINHNASGDIELRSRPESQRPSTEEVRGTPMPTPNSEHPILFDASAAHTALSVSSQWKAVLRQRDTHVFALFCLFYVGTEVSIGGWTSTYIIRVLGEIDESGAIVSGFWAGLAAGRVLLIPVTNLLGPQIATLAYLAVSVGLQMVIWFVPNIVASGVSVAIMGLLLGPIFPIMIELISVRIIPRSAQTLAITIVVAFGSAGAALFPLIVGLVIQKHGAKALAPTLLAFLCAQICIFLLLGKPKKIAEGEAIRAME